MTAGSGAADGASGQRRARQCKGAGGYQSRGSKQATTSLIGFLIEVDRDLLHRIRLIKDKRFPVLLWPKHPSSTKTPPKRGLCIHDSTACGGILKISDGHIDSTVDTIRAPRGVAQCTASLFAAATVFSSAG